jgi:very-short-patch-repair endonuclease
MPRTRWRAPAAIQRRARELRRELTPAEGLLWRRLRGKQFGPYHFRKQHPVGRFIVDFFCARAKLVIEVDGDTHALQSRYDAERTAWLETQRDYRVLRFANTDVHTNIDAVCEPIAELLRATLPGAPPP